MHVPTCRQCLEFGPRQFEHRQLSLIKFKKSLKALTTQGSSWRRGWDLNPRYPCRYAAFRVRCIRPLCHLSAGTNCEVRAGVLITARNWAGSFAASAPNVAAACHATITIPHVQVAENLVHLWRPASSASGYREARQNIRNAVARKNE